nr:hypothetical protein [Cotesia vestalis bracovirus]QZB49102.1 BV-like protein [Cotesia vestalis bracovirus]
MFFSKILFVLLVATLGTSWFSEGGSTAVDALPQGYTVHQQYSFQNGTGNQQASVVNGSVVQQSFQQVWSTMPLLQLPFGFYNPSDDNSYKD